MSSSKNRIEWYNEDTFLRISDELPFCDLVKWSWTCWDNISKKERVFSTWLDKSKPKSTAIPQKKTKKKIKKKSKKTKKNQKKNKKINQQYIKKTNNKQKKPKIIKNQ